MMNHYQVLEVSRTASAEEIKAAYRKLALKYHPDKVAPELKDDATKMFHAIAVAFQVLSDPATRASFDRSLFRPPQRPAVTSSYPTSSSALTPYRPPSPSSAAYGRSPSPNRMPSPHFGNRASTPPPFFRPPSPGLGMRPTSPSLTGYGSGYGNGSGLTRRPSMEGFGLQQYHSPPPPLPTVNPHDLFDQLVGSVHASQANPQGFLESEEEMALRRRIEREPDLQARVNAMLVGGDPLRGINGDSVRRRNGGGGSTDPWAKPPESFGKDPWGRNFSGEIRPATMQRGRSLSSSLQEGEKHRNGNYRIRQQKHDVEELNDGTIKWSSSSVEVRYTSGTPRGRSSSRDRSNGATRSSSRNRSSTPPPTFYPNGYGSQQNGWSQPPQDYPTLQYHQQSALPYHSQNQRPALPYNAQRQLSLPSSSANSYPALTSSSPTTYGRMLALQNGSAANQLALADINLKMLQNGTGTPASEYATYGGSGSSMRSIMPSSPTHSQAMVRAGGDRSLARSNSFSWKPQ